MQQNFEPLLTAIREIRRVTLDGSIQGLRSGRIDVVGLGRAAKIGDMVEFCPDTDRRGMGEILALENGVAQRDYFLASNGLGA